MRKRAILAILLSSAIMVISFQNCSRQHFSGEERSISLHSGEVDNTPTEDDPLCDGYVDPNACPLDNTASIEGLCSKCDDGEISRYRALILAFRMRGSPICVSKVDYFPNDSVCPSDGSGDPRICTPYLPLKLTAKTCINAAATNPAITVGVGGQKFGHSPVTHSQSYSFMTSSVLVPKCGISLYEELLSLPKDEILERQSEINGYSSVTFWGKAYIMFKLRLITAANAQASDSSHFSLSEYQDLMSRYKAAVDSRSCSEIRDLVLSVSRI